MRVEAVTEGHYAAWDQFVGGHDSGTAFHLSAMIQLQAQLPYLRPIALAAFDEGGAMIGGIAGVVSVEKPGVLSLLSTRAVVFGAPLIATSADRQVILPALQAEFGRIAKKRHALFSEVWLTRQLEDREIWNELGYEWVPHLNFLVDLQLGEAALWERLSASRRKNIRRAIRFGVEVEAARTWEQYAAMHRIVARNYREMGLPMYPVTFFRAIFSQLVPLGLARGYVALRDGRIIGGRIILCYKNRLHDWYAGSDAEARCFYPDELLVWRILQQHTAEGYDIFDFGGAGHPDVDYGPREFKRRFGGVLVNYGRLRVPHAPGRLWLVEHGFEVYRRIAVVGAGVLGKARRKQGEPQNEEQQRS